VAKLSLWLPCPWWVSFPALFVGHFCITEFNPLYFKQTLLSIDSIMGCNFYGLRRLVQFYSQFVLPPKESRGEFSSHSSCQENLRSLNCPSSGEWYFRWTHPTWTWTKIIRFLCPRKAKKSISRCWASEGGKLIHLLLVLRCSFFPQIRTKGTKCKSKIMWIFYIFILNIHFYIFTLSIHVLYWISYIYKVMSI